MDDEQYHLPHLFNRRAATPFLRHASPELPRRRRCQAEMLLPPPSGAAIDASIARRYRRRRRLRLSRLRRIGARPLR